MPNNRVKRLIKDVEGLGFTYDPEKSSPRRGKSVYRHANVCAGGEIVIQEKLSDNGVTAVWKRAQQIVGLSTTGPSGSRTKEMQRAFREAERARVDKERRAVQERAREAEAEHDARLRVAREAKRTREIESLMQPRWGK